MTWTPSFYAYDGDGNRVSETMGSTTTKFLVDDRNPTGYAQVMDELVNGSVTRTYTYGRQLISENQLIGGTWTPSFYGYDGHGNARFLANSSGTLTDTYQFDAFGAQIASSGTTPNPYLYSGERFDTSLNLYHLRARYYNALTGRFQTMDADPGNIADPKTLHKYVYTANNPINWADPSGNGTLDEAVLLGVGFHQLVLVPTVQGTVALAPYVAGLGGELLLQYCYEVAVFGVATKATGQPGVPWQVNAVCAAWSGWRIANR